MRGIDGLNGLGEATGANIWGVIEKGITQAGTSFDSYLRAGQGQPIQQTTPQGQTVVVSGGTDWTRTLLIVGGVALVGYVAYKALKKR